MVFLDTPGIVDPAYLLHHAMAGIVEEAISDADVIVLLLDGTRPPPPLAEEVVSTLRAAGRRLLVVINKGDEAADTSIAALRQWTSETLGILPEVISAATGMGVPELRDRIAERLPESPFLFPEDEISTQSVRFFVAELVRESVFELFQEEIPYSVATKVDEFQEGSTPLVIRTIVFVERPSQKAILIGKGGAAIRELGIHARSKIEEFLEQRVYLELWVKVLPKWRKSSLELRRLGFPVPQERQ